MYKEAQRAYSKYARMYPENSLKELLAAIENSSKERVEEGRTYSGTDPEDNNTYARPTTHHQDVENLNSIEEPYYTTPAMPPPDAI